MGEFCCFFVPSRLHSDQEKKFESKVISAICQLLQMDKSRTIYPIPPTLVRLAEQFNRMLTDMLVTTAKKHPFEWERHLQKVCFAYNTSVHASTGQPPFFLMFGRRAQLPLDLVFKADVSPYMTTPDYAVELMRNLEAAYEKVR